MNRKILLRIVFVLFSLWIILLGILYISSGKYLDHAIGMLKIQLDNHLSTEIQIKKEDIHLSLIRNFPYASLQLEHILIKSSPVIKKEDFPMQDIDTLLYADKISLIFNLKSLLSKKYQLNKIDIEGATLRLLSDMSGDVNYTIIKTSIGDTLQDTVCFDLKKVTLEKVQVSYQDAKSGFFFSGNVSHAEMTGSFTSDNFIVNAQVKTYDDNLLVHDIVYLKKELMTLNLTLRWQSGVYTLTGGNVALFGVSLKTEGKYISDSKEYYLTFSCNAMPLQRIRATLQMRWPDKLALLPYNGDLSLRGKITGKSLANPLIAVQFKVSDGILRNSKKTLKVTDFYTQGYYNNGQKRNQLSSFLKIDSLSARSGKSILFLSGQVQNFIAPYFEGKVRGYIELEKLLVIESLVKKFDLSGIVKGNIRAKGSLSSFKKPAATDINRLLLQGTLQFDNAYIKPLKNSLPASTVSGIVIVKNTQEIRLEDISVRTGRSDLQIQGEVSHLPIFSIDKKVFPYYRCKVRSGEFHVEDYMPGSSAGNENAFKIEFPDSLIVTADISIKSFSFGKFNANDVSGDFSYTPKTVLVRNFTMNTQGGKLQSDLRITQLQDKLIAESDAVLNHVDLKGLFYAFNEFGQTVITHEYIDGFLSGTTYSISAWDLYLNPIYKELKLTSQVTIEKGEIINYAPLLGLSDYIEVEELKDIRFEKLQTSIRVENEKVTVGQMQINSSAISLTGSGEHNFDNSYIYRFQVELSDVLWKKAKKRKPENTEFGYVVDDGLGRHTIPLAITGKDTVFEVIYDKKTAGNMLQEKLSKEKQVWHELISPSDQPIEGNEQKAPIDWEDEQTPIKNQDSIKTEKKKEDFIIEWEDE